MKEYLVKTDSGKFLWTKDASDILADRVIAIPYGAEAAMRYKSGEIEFFKENYAYFWFDKFKEWKSTKNAPKFYESAFIIWQRPTHPDPLPFIDDNPQSLNDQYAEIEQVRQNQKTIDAMHKAEGILNDKQLKWSQWDLQVGGDHYKSMKIQPAKFALENKLDYCQANAIKYICRHESKNGKQDLEKAKHYIDLLIEHYYGDQNAI